MAKLETKVPEATTPKVAPTITAHAARGHQPATKADLDALEARLIAAIAANTAQGV